MEITEATGKQLVRELAMVKELLRKKDEQWVKVTVVLRRTGWTKEQLRRARLRGEIKFKKDKGGIWYDYSSLLPIHLLDNKKTA